MTLHERLRTQSAEKMASARWVEYEKTPLDVTRCLFGIPNSAPRALIGAFSGSTAMIQLVLTGPGKYGKS